MKMISKTVKRTIKEFIETYKGEDYVTFISGIFDESLSLHFMDIYKFHFEDNSVILTLDAEEKEKYRYHPKYLSKSLYGSPDLWFTIMSLNKVTHPGDLTLEGDIVVLAPSAVNQLVRFYASYKKNIKYEDNTNTVV